MAGKVVFQGGKLRNHLIGTGVIMAGWVVGSYVPNTWGVQFAKRYIKTGSPYCKSVSAEPETEALLNEVVNDINAYQDTPVKLDGIEFLQTNMKNPGLLHKGNSSTGALVCLPIGTRCNAEDVFHYHFPNTYNEAEAQYCIFSRDAKKFIFAREIFYVEDSYILFRILAGLGLTAAGSLVHYFWNSAQDKLKQMKIQIEELDVEKRRNVEKLTNELKGKALRHRKSTFFVLVFVCYQLYKIVDADYNWKLEKAADEKVAKLGKDYQRGGLEYYSKFTTMNKLRPNTKYDSNGDLLQSKYLVFQRHLPLSLRYQYFGSLLPNNKLSETVHQTSS